MNKKGFTLVEFTVVMVVISILVSVTVPFIMGHIDSAKWTEGKTAMGTIATALHTYCVEQVGDLSTPPLISSLGFTADDLKGLYFDINSYSIDPTGFVFHQDGSELNYKIIATHGGLTPTRYTLDQDGSWGF